jgi:hypothetical protein
LSSYTAYTASDLIADINAANKAGGANTISPTAPTTHFYTLTAVNNSTNGYNGLPVIAANDNLTIVGNGDRFERTASRNPGFRFFDVAAGASLTLQNLYLEFGFAQLGRGGAAGGAIYNQGALTLSGVHVDKNQADGSGSGAFGVPAGGGGIWSNGSLTLENGTVLGGNVARGGDPGGAAFGGAVYVAGGTANITNTTFLDNSAIGGLSDAPYGPQVGGNAFGGALYVAAGQVVLTNAAVNNNLAINPGGSPTPSGYGGGLYVAGGTVTLASDTVESNAVRGGGYGGGLFIAKGATVYIDAFTLADVINNTAAIDPNIDGTYIKT